MKHLIFLRHAKSSWKNPFQHDLDRPLNKRGQKDAPVMIRRLLIHGRPDLVLASPAMRVQLTIKPLLSAYPDTPVKTLDELYLIDPDALLTCIANTDDSVHRLWVVGHNPGLTDCHNKLAKTPLDNIPTAGFVSFLLDLESWSRLPQLKGIYGHFDYPKRG